MTNICGQNIQTDIVYFVLQLFHEYLMPRLVGERIKLPVSEHLFHCKYPSNPEQIIMNYDGNYDGADVERI